MIKCLPNWLIKDHAKWPSVMTAHHVEVERPTKHYPQLASEGHHLHPCALAPEHLLRERGGGQFRHCWIAPSLAVAVLPCGGRRCRSK
jgi:hypothetical protein